VLGREAPARYAGFVSISPSLLPLLQVFLAVARHRSFTGAARELGVTRSAVSQSVRQLEEHLRVVLFARTTRSVSLTDDGRRLVDAAAPAVAQALAALTEVAAKPGEAIGRLRLTVPRSAVPFVIEPVLAQFRARAPRVDVEVNAEDRLVDIVAEGYDAGVRSSDIIERDMIQVRLTDPFRFVIVGAPSYFAKRGRPEKPEDLLKHDCGTFRSPTTGALYAWELERGKRTWRVPVKGGVVTNDSALQAALAAQGVSLAYAFEPTVKELVRTKKLEIVLERYAASVEGFFLYFPSRSQRSPPLRHFIEVAKEFARRA
jgi:DNA-binding transcriptional LysR family regulator